jgi:hypothetical protein
MTWHGPYAPLDGEQVSRAYGSALDLSFTVPGGLLMRQTHHWAALLFLVAITVHLLRVAFTAAFRRPRGLTYAVDVTLLMLAVVEGYAGYSLLDDLLSGMGLAIGYSTALSLPGVGGALGALVWDGPFPGGPAFGSRLFIAHVFLLPAAIATLIGAHLFLIVRTRHTQFPGPGQRERNALERKKTGLLEDLRADLKGPLGENAAAAAKFTTVVLLDDFSASGISYARPDEPGKGKIARLAGMLRQMPDLVDHDDPAPEARLRPSAARQAPVIRSQYLWRFPGNPPLRRRNRQMTLSSGRNRRRMKVKWSGRRVLLGGRLDRGRG